MSEPVTGDTGPVRSLPVGRVRELPDRPSGLGRVGLMAAVAVLLQITLMPYITVADGCPDIVVTLVVIVAVLRGPFVGAVAGFGSGFLVEITSPMGTLGVLALLYLLVGWWCGRFADRPEAQTLGLPLGLVVAAALFVQVGYAVFQLLLGTEIAVSAVAGRMIVPTIVLTALIAPLVLVIARRLLGAPVVVQPGMLAG
ncbi:MAG: rod shape-determining protein MreD [Thermoleophilia bacterium]|nr:rod shape-determining protein MreD [Thermoleophilia bacterium]